MEPEPVATDPNATAGGPFAGRRPTGPELARVLADHGRWFQSGGTEGVQADLSRADLADAELRGVNLQGAILRGTRLKRADLQDADLQDADLSGANLQAANLQRADLKQTRLRGAVLRDANFREADLTGARGILSGQFGGADLASAKLPPEANTAEGLANVAEASKTAQNLFFSILLACAYTWLTVASTRDPQLLNNAAPASSRLPVLGVDIPLVQFYLVAPLLLTCLYVYFHLCLQRLWEEMGELPAVFPDGRALDRKAYPWLLNALVRVHAPRLRQRRSNMTRWQAGISVILAWGLVPLTVILLWARYLRAHDWMTSTSHVAMLALILGACGGFRRLATATLKGAERRPFLWRRAWHDARVRATALAVGSAVVLGILTYGVVEGVNPEIERRGIPVAQPGRFEKLVDIRHWVPQLFLAVGYSPFAALDDATLSVKPSNWTKGTPEELPNVRGVDLEGRNLRYATAYNCFGVNGYFMEADLRHADLREADLRGADFRHALADFANLRNSNLTNADLRFESAASVNFTDAMMDGTRAADTRFPNSRFTHASLAQADFSGADLTGADLTGANLAGTDLTAANLTDVVGLTLEQLATAQIDDSTRLPAELRSQLARLAPAMPPAAPRTVER